jgi:hypothetical protein
MKNWKLKIKESLLTGYNKMVPPVGVEPTLKASESFAEVPYVSSFSYNPCHNSNLVLEISHIVVKYCIFYCGI